MHQPWASLLVHGIKRIEGRSWPSPITGRLWIHAASKVPEDATIETMENFYREIYALDGIKNLNFPKNYPVSSLIGCVEVVGCLKREELACWTEVPAGVSLEALTDFCWLCENPQKLQVPLQMGGNRGVYDLEISDADVASLVQVETPFPVEFPLPNPGDPFSLKPGSLSPRLLGPKVEKSPELRAVIDATSRAATQFLNNNNNYNHKKGKFSRQEDARGSNNLSLDNRNKGKFSRSEDARFVRRDPYIQNPQFDNRNQRDFDRSAATKYVKKEQNVGYNGFDSRNKRVFSNNGVMNRNYRDFTRPGAAHYVKKEPNIGNKRELHAPIHTQFVQKDKIDDVSSLSNNLSGQCRIEDGDCSLK